MGRLKILLILVFLSVFISCEPIDLLLSIMETADPPEWELVQTLSTGEIGTGDDYYGAAVSAADGYVVVGSMNVDGSFRGAAYIYRLDEEHEAGPWVFEEKIISNDYDDVDLFGGSVAVSGHTVVVASQGIKEIEIYEHDGSSWVYQEDFDAGGGEYGWALDIDGDHIVVGDWAAGTARFYHRSSGTWSPVDTENPAADRYGWAVAVSGNYAAVGADEYDGADTDTGAVYIYQWNGTNWDELTRIDPPDDISLANFGNSVAMRSGLLVVGAPGAGLAYIYRLNEAEWEYDGKMSIGGVLLADEFGRKSAITDRMTAISSPKYDSERGKIHIIEEYDNIWKDTEATEYLGEEPGDKFGYSVAMYEKYVFVGAPRDGKTAGTDTGSVYVYSRGSITGIK